MVGTRARRADGLAVCSLFLLGVMVKGAQREAGMKEPITMNPGAVAFKDNRMGARHRVKLSFCLIIAIENDNCSKKANTGRCHRQAFKRAHRNPTSAKSLPRASRSQQHMENRYLCSKDLEQWLNFLHARYT